MPYQRRSEVIRAWRGLRSKSLNPTKWNPRNPNFCNCGRKALEVRDGQPRADIRASYGMCARAAQLHRRSEQDMQVAERSDEISYDAAGAERGTGTAASREQGARAVSSGEKRFVYRGSVGARPTLKVGYTNALMEALAARLLWSGRGVGHEGDDLQGVGRQL